MQVVAVRKKNFRADLWLVLSRVSHSLALPRPAGRGLGEGQVRASWTRVKVGLEQLGSVYMSGRRQPGTLAQPLTHAALK